MVNVAWRQQRQRAMPMLRVVPARKVAKERARRDDICKGRRKGRLIFRRLEERLDLRVVVADVRPRMALGHPQIGQQERDRLRGHRATTIGVYSELVRVGAFSRDRFGKQRARQLGGFALGKHPAHDVAAVDVDDDVEVGVGPLLRPVQLGDVPGPHLTRRGRAQFGLDVRGRRRLIAPFAYFTDAVQNAVHRGHRAVIRAFVQERGVDIRPAAIDEALLVNRIEHGLPFPRRKRQG